MFYVLSLATEIPVLENSSGRLQLFNEYCKIKDIIKNSNITQDLLREYQFIKCFYQTWGLCLREILKKAP